MTLFSERGLGNHMESDLRYYTRRLSMERIAAKHALTDEARARRMLLVDLYSRKLAALLV